MILSSLSSLNLLSSTFFHSSHHHFQYFTIYVQLSTAPSMPLRDTVQKCELYSNNYQMLSHFMNADLFFFPPFGTGLNTDFRHGRTTFSMKQFVSSTPWTLACGEKQNAPKKFNIHYVQLGIWCLLTVCMCTSGSVCVSSQCAVMALKSSKTFSSTAQIVASFQAFMPPHLIPHRDHF